MKAKTVPTYRRAFLGGGLAVLATAFLSRKLTAAAGQSTPGAPATGQAATAAREVTIENFSTAGKSEGTVRVEKVIKSEAEWRAQLSPLAYNVARQQGTELPYSGEYATNHAEGVYRCICCDTALYDSGTKFESGTGWPSFWRPISAKNVIQSSDTSLMMQRDAISCRRCDAHLGHVFDDGPRPTGLRYCMNSVSLRLVKRA
jgi:peptide-methionine (R)-S-oxide reductase